jgi:bifunctional UDP-N-acetylglucosamine pyrophosphorylase / glucosamine-1-phosphate N-acetyltransferase
LSLAIVILAAGKGTRMNSRRPKVLHEIGGKSLLAHVIAAANRIVAAEDIVVVAGHGSERVKASLASTGVRFVLQVEQLGTGDAIRSAEPAIAGYENVLVLPGDVPLIRTETLEALVAHHTMGPAMTILTARPQDSFGFGRVVHRASENVLEVEAVIDEEGFSSERSLVPEIDTGIYAFRTKSLMACAHRLTEENGDESISEGETDHASGLGTGHGSGAFDLADVARDLLLQGELVAAVECLDAAEVLAVDTIAELVALDSSLRYKTALRLMENGVTIYRPETCVIDADVEVGADTVIEPNVQLLGKTRIGSDCLIRSGTVIENSTLADGVLIRQSCIVTDSTIETGATIGPFAHLRPGSEIGEDAHIGNFVETKKARIGKGAKAGHLSYLGDADIGAGTNIGAGVITCNYDGVRKHRTKIGEGAFVGSDSTLVAPVIIREGAYIAAGSCITKEVPPGSLAVARSRQVVKEGWAAARRKLQQDEC